MKQIKCDKCGYTKSETYDRSFYGWGKARVGEDKPRDLCSTCYKEWIKYLRKFFDTDVS